MRKPILIKRMIFFWIMLMLPPMSLLGNKVWVNNPNITEPSPFAPVVDEDLYIEGTNFLANHIHIAANTVDVVVTTSGGPAVVMGNTPTAALHIFAAPTHTVTFELQQDLMFRGSTQDLLITFSGGGNLIFEVAGDHNLTFSSVGASGGAYFLVNMDNVTHTPNFDYSVLFSRFPLGSLGAAEQDLNAFVGIGPRSVISFIAPTLAEGATGFEGGIIAFDPSNTTDHTGRLILWVQDHGSILVQGNANNNANATGFGDINLTDIDFSERAGNSAEFKILSQDPGVDWAGLLVINSNKGWAQLQSNPWCEAIMSTTQLGFILGPNGVLQTNDGTYLDYVGTVTNYTFYPTVSEDVIEAHQLEGQPVSQYIKDRNPSALIVDGSSNPYATQQAEINMLGTSAIYFRSGTDSEGLYTFTVFDPLVGDAVISFTIDPIEESRGPSGYGEIVFDVEGPVRVTGTPDTALNILSLHVTPTGGSVLIEAADTIFPLRTYRRDEEGRYLQYNLASFMINNRMDLITTNLQHTDELHEIFPDNFPQQSEATYVGGESWWLCEDRPRPNIVFFDSNFLIHTSAALTGVDLFVPNDQFDLGQNLSNFIFYTNGRVIDQGSGRFLIMGTTIGALASDYNHIINQDAHIDVFQEFVSTGTDLQILSLLTAPNNSKVTEGLTYPIPGQNSIQTIYLDHASNISIGTNGTTGIDPVTGLPFDLTTVPTLFINGDFFSFMTAGGTTHQPDLSMSTGEGGMFVDAQGVVQIECERRANMAMVVTKSHNGIVDLPKRQVFFNLRVGIANWRLDLSDPSQLVLVDTNQTISDYTLDWANITKDFTVDPTAGFIAYEPANTPPVCQQPIVTQPNLTNLPIVRGTVDQFQIKNSRLGDEANLLVDGGLIREFVMLTGIASATAPVGFLVLQNDAHVGLGTAHRNVDSDEAQVVLGLNGIELCANGPAEVVLNEDTIINNVCHILTGTGFGLTDKDQLFISSVVPRELRVKNEAVLDLTSFDTPNKELVIGGKVTLVFEPGAQLVMGGGKFRIADEASVVFEPFFDENLPVGSGLTATNNFRVKWTGSGNFIMSENAQMYILRDAFVGIESAGLITQTSTSSVIQTCTIENCSYITSQTWTLRDAARINIGSDTDFGGSLQIGNVTDLSANGANVDFRLEFNGSGSIVDVNSQGFLGLGVGVINKLEDAINTWTVAPTFNVSRIDLDLQLGTFRNAQTFDGDNKLAGLLAIGDVDQFNFVINKVNVDLLGGGNVVQILAPTGVNVTNFSGAVSASQNVGIMVSSAMLLDASKLNVPPSPVAPTVVGEEIRVLAVTPSIFFQYIIMPDFNVQSTHTATIFQGPTFLPIAGFVNGTLINRLEVERFVAIPNNPSTILNATNVGYIGLALDSQGENPQYQVNNLA